MEKTIGVYLWQNLTMLDVLGPHQFLGFVPGFKVVTFAKTTDSVVTDTDVRLIPDYGFSTCPTLDILLVGGGVNPLSEMQDDEVMLFLRQAAEGAEYVTSVCTGALILAEAGLLKGYRATTHWAYKEQLALYPGVEVASGRVVTDRNRITGGGVTAGIDFALTLIGQLAGPEAAAGLQLMAEYDPSPPPTLVLPIRRRLSWSRRCASSSTRWHRIWSSSSPSSPADPIANLCVAPSRAPKGHRFDHRWGRAGDLDRTGMASLEDRAAIKDLT